MLKVSFKSGNILNSEADCIVNPVNTVGVMGAGLAKQFKTKYPINYTLYKEHCSKVENDFRKYRIFFHEENNKIICNLATKEHYNKPSRLSYIRRSLMYLWLYLEEEPYSDDIQSIAIPPLGCGLGGLNQLTILHLILYRLKFVSRPLTVELYGFSDVKKPVKDFILKHYDLMYRQLPRFTAVGSRELTLLGEERLVQALNLCIKKDMLLCTGDASMGADNVVWKNYQGKKIRFGPIDRKRYAKDVQVINPDSPQYEIATSIVSKTHPAWRFIKGFARELHIRNAFQVLGANLSRPSEFLVCWTPDGAESTTSRKTGGTGTAIRIANYFGIPVFNLQNDDALERLYEFLGADYSKLSEQIIPYY